MSSKSSKCVLPPILNLTIAVNVHIVVQNHHWEGDNVDDWPD